MVDTSKPIKHILVVGGGLGGFALGQALRKSNLMVTIFERDMGLEARHQGYILGVNGQGEKALLSLDVPLLTSLITAYSSKLRSFKLTDQNFEKLMQFPYGGKGEGFLVDRYFLRDLLMHDLGKEGGNVKIEWGKRFVRYEEKPDKVIVHFEDGTTAEGDVLIGADGARSRVREQRTEKIKYEQMPVANIGAFIKAPARPVLQRLQDSMETCLIRAMGCDGVSLLAMPFTDPVLKESTIVWSLTFPYNLQVPEPNELKPLLLEKAALVAPEAVELVNSTPLENFLPHTMVYTCVIKDKPLGATTRVTLMGDAAHAMTSHAGLGGNTALLDVIDLAKALTSANWYTDLCKYEQKMVKRGCEHVKTSADSTKRMTQAGGKVRNWSMWLIGKFIGGQAKD